MKSKPDLSRIRVCEARCVSCIFGPRSPISAERRREYEAAWRRRDTFQNCHMGTVTGDRALMCRGFYDWCKAVGWEPTAIQLGERLDRLVFVPIPTESELSMTTTKKRPDAKLRAVRAAAAKVKRAELAASAARDALGVALAQAQGDYTVRELADVAEMSPTATHGLLKRGAA